MGNHKGAVTAFASGARRRIGLARRHRREPSSALWINEPVMLSAGTVHAVDRALAVAAALGVPTAAADFGGAKLFRGAPAPAAVDPAAPNEAAETPFVLLHPGAGWRNKEYPAASWGEVARGLQRTAGLPTLVTVAGGEEPLAAAVVAAGGPAARAVAAPDLPALAALIRQARLVLGGDTGPLHLAHALGVPVLALYGPTDPARNGPYGAPERALSHRLPCSFCHKRFAETKACLVAIPPAAVVERALSLLGS